MTQNKLAKIPIQEIFHQIRCSRVGKVTVPGEDALFEGPRPFRTILQHFFVMITFQDEGMCITNSFDGQRRGVAQIG